MFNGKQVLDTLISSESLPIIIIQLRVPAIIAINHAPVQIYIQRLKRSVEKNSTPNMHDCVNTNDIVYKQNIVDIHFCTCRHGAYMCVWGWVVDITCPYMKVYMFVCLRSIGYLCYCSDKPVCVLKPRYMSLSSIQHPRTLHTSTESGKARQSCLH